MGADDRATDRRASPADGVPDLDKMQRWKAGRDLASLRRMVRRAEPERLYGFPRVIRPPVLLSAMRTNANLPAAIQVLRDVLAADHRQARTDSLLAILGAGPDYVREHATVLDAAL